MTSTPSISQDLFDRAVALLGARPTGAIWTTPSSVLGPVSLAGRPGILKVTGEPEEAHGLATLARWRLGVTCPILALATLPTGETAAVMPHARGTHQATDADLVTAANRLHAGLAGAGSEGLVPLEVWLSSVLTANAPRGTAVADAQEIAVDLLAHPRDQVPLHGDVHHENLLDFGEPGGPPDLRLIDPKGLFGERGYDFANIMFNPQPYVRPTAQAFEARSRRIAEQAGLDYERYLKWITVYGTLSALWFLEDGEQDGHGVHLSEVQLDTIRLAISLLGVGSSEHI